MIFYREGGEIYNYFDKQGQAWEDAIVRKEARLEQPQQPKELYAINRRGAEEGAGLQDREGAGVGLQVGTPKGRYHTDPRWNAFLNPNYKIMNAQDSFIKRTPVILAGFLGFIHRGKMKGG